MAKTYQNFEIHHYWRVISVWATFMVVNYLWYGLGSPLNVYLQDFPGKALWTGALALAFTAIYNHSSTWRPMVNPHTPKEGVNRIISSIIFSSLIFVLILAAIALSHYLVSFVYIYVLQGIRAEIPESVVDDLALLTEVVAGGLVLELHGKDETSERVDGP